MVSIHLCRKDGFDVRLLIPRRLTKFTRRVSSLPETEEG